MIRLLVGSTMALTAVIAAAQHFPSKPIRIVTSEPGGGLDVSSRLLAPALTANLGQQVVIDNRGAAGGAVAGETVAKAQPDGHTLIYYGPPLWLLPFMRRQVPYDPIKDFAPITVVAKSPNLIIVPVSLPVKSVKELVSLAASKPGELNYGTSGTGSSPHLAAELFKAMAGVNLTRVDYKGSALTVTALLSGEIQVLFPNAATVMPH